MNMLMRIPTGFLILERTKPLCDLSKPVNSIKSRDSSPAVLDQNGKGVLDETFETLVFG